MVHKFTNTVFEITLLLLKKDHHIREMARKLGVSHPTILRRLKELEESGFINHRERGRNKEYFLRKNLKTRNLAYIAERYKQLKLYEEYPELQFIFEKIRGEFNGIVILFGSYTKFKAKEDSDIDVYLETSNLKVKKKIERINSKLNVKLGKFDLNSALIKEVIKNHVIIQRVGAYYEKLGFFE